MVRWLLAESCLITVVHFYPCMRTITTLVIDVINYLSLEGTLKTYSKYTSITTTLFYFILMHVHISTYIEGLMPKRLNNSMTSALGHDPLLFCINLYTFFYSHIIMWLLLLSLCRSSTLTFAYTHTSVHSYVGEDVGSGPPTPGVQPSYPHKVFSSPPAPIFSYSFFFWYPRPKFRIVAPPIFGQKPAYPPPPHTHTLVLPTLHIYIYIYIWVQSI